MTFEVDLVAMDSLTNLLDRATQDTSAMRSYWERNAGLNFLGEGVINFFQGADDRAERNIGTYLDTITDQTMPGMREAVELAAKYYRATDRANAERIDGAMPGVNVTEVAAGDAGITYDYYHPPAPFSDAADPSVRLASLPDYNTEMPYEPSWTDISSPTGLLRDAIWAVTWLGMKLGVCDRQYDIAEVVLKPVCGDWAGMKATGVTMHNLSDAAVDLHANLGRAILGIQANWQGNAADAAVAHLLRIRKSLYDSAVSLRKIGQEYVSAADACHSMSKTIGNILSDITDAAVVAAASGAASGALGASGVGLPVALLLGAFTVTKVYKVCREVINIIKIIADMVSRVNALSDAVDSGAGDFGLLRGGDFSSGGLPPTPALPR